MLFGVTHSTPPVYKRRHFFCSNIQIILNLKLQNKAKKSFFIKIRGGLKISAEKVVCSEANIYIGQAKYVDDFMDSPMTNKCIISMTC